MTETEAKTIRNRLEGTDSFEIRGADDGIVHSYYFDHIEQVFCRLTIDGVTPFADSVHVYDDFSVMYKDVLCQYEFSFVEQRIQTTMSRIGRLYELCVMENVDEESIAKMLHDTFNYELLIWDRKNSTYGYMTPLQALILRRPAASASIALFMQKGVHPNKTTGLSMSQRTAFFHACAYAHYDEVQLMLPYVDINLALNHTSYWDKPTALMTCIENFSEDSPIKEARLATFRLLLEHGADINYVHPNGDSAIMKIIDSRKVEYFAHIPHHVSLQLNYHSKETTWSDNTCTPIGFCVKKWTVHNDLASIFRTLMERGADINMKDGTGQPPLFYSIWNEMIEVFDQTEVNWNATNKKGQSALAHYASFGKKKTEIPARLLERGVDIDRTDEHGDTALHIALRNKDSVLALFLLDQGCRLDIGNHSDEYPLDIAKEGKMSAVISKMEHCETLQNTSIENLCIQILEEGFEYAFESKKITHRTSDPYEWFFYANRKAKHYMYRNYSCTREWLREYFCALVLKESNTAEQQYFLSFVNKYLSQIRHPAWTMDELKKQFEASYLSEQIELIVSKEEVAQTCVAFLKAGHSFTRSDKEGFANYTYHSPSNLFHHKYRGDDNPKDQSYTEQEFHNLCVRVVQKTDDNPYQMDFKGFFHSNFQEVLVFLGFESWRAWKRAKQLRSEPPFGVDSKKPQKKEL